MGNDDPPEWWIMYFQVRDELSGDYVSHHSRYLMLETHVIFEVYIYLLKCPCRH